MSTTQVVLSKSAGRLGVSCTDNPAGAGVLVSSLVDGSVAAAAGLHVGDVILTVNGLMVDDHRACVAAIDGAPDRVAFVLARPTRSIFLDKRDGRIGITCNQAGEQALVLVSALEEGSLASEAGLFVGDTLLSVNGVLARTHQQAVELIDEADGSVELVVLASTRAVRIAKQAAASVGLTVADRVDGGAGVVVIGLEPGGLAVHKLGLGDTILAVEGSLVQSHIDAIEAVDFAEGAFTLVVGERATDLSRILETAIRSSARGRKASSPSAAKYEYFGVGPCEPVLERHEPLGNYNRQL